MKADVEMSTEAITQLTVQNGVMDGIGAVLVPVLGKNSEYL